LKDKDNSKQAKTKTTKKPITKKGEKPKRSIRSKYETHVEPKLDLIIAMCRDGATEESIAKSLGVAYSTFRVHKDKHPALQAALKNGREVANAQVENKLFTNTQGQVVKLKKPMKIKTTIYNDETGYRISEKEEIVYVDEEQYVPPHFGAQTFWLINRSDGKWQNTQNKEIKYTPESNEMLKSISVQINNKANEKNDDDIDMLDDGDNA